ncbi:MAG: glycosyltransferase [Lachnospiraceae bacterium]|jgi:spore maturation protein CgeB|nr:glycosyltransferase [Lachnospiraceae bacterium]
MEKLISIILPCYNVEQYIDRCFSSLKNQTLGFENMELIFVNDASTDGTLKKLEELEKQYPDNIIVINFTENRRQGTARNTALEYASAPYIGYVDSDDWVDVTMFEKMVNAIREYDCDFVECRWSLSRDERHSTSVKKLGANGYLDLTDPSTRAKFIGDQIGITALWSKVFKKSFLVENDIFCPEQIRYEDIFFCYLAFLYAKSYYRIDEELYHYFVNPEGTVQRKSQEYQFDKMTIALGFLDACRQRGLLDDGTDNNNDVKKELSDITTKDCIEWMFLEKYYVYMLWEVFQEFSDRSYDCYLEMKETIFEQVPNFKTNPFRSWESNAFDNLMLNFLDYDIGREDFESLRDDLLAKFDKKPVEKRKYKILFCKRGSICEDGISNAFKYLKYDVDFMTKKFESYDYDSEYLTALSETMQKKQYDCVFTVNFIPIVARCCKVFNIPYVSWTVDNPDFELFSNTIELPTNRIFMFDRSQYEKFKPKNPDHIYYMPLACDYEAWNSFELTAEDHRNYDCDISFIGSTYEEKCRYNDIVGDLSDFTRGYVDGLIAAQLNVYGYNFLEDAMTDEFVKQFKKEVGWYPLGEDYTEDDRAIIADTYVGYKCTEQERFLTLKNISENFNLDLWTLSDTSRFPKANVRGGADSITMMPKIFKCSKINLSMTNRPIRTGMPLRMFDTMGAGGFLLTNYQAEIPEYFEIGRDLEVYESQEDLLNKIAYYLEHDDERIQIAKNGQEKVKNEHSYKIKLEKMLKIAGI